LTMMARTSRTWAAGGDFLSQAERDAAIRSATASLDVNIGTTFPREDDRSPTMTMHCMVQYIYMHSLVQLGIRMADRTSSHETGLKIRRGGSREAIVEAAERLFLERGFGSVSMDELAEAAGVARRTLYNQFASKEEIFREMLLRVARQLEDAFPPGIETQGDVEEVLRKIARVILDLHQHAEYLGFLRMVVADSRQFPWIAKEFAAVMDPRTERFMRYLAHVTALGLLDCPDPLLAAHQFMGMLNEFSLWPWMMGRENIAVPTENVIEETIRMFLSRYGRTRPKKRGYDGAA
jgi:TetR/AcrR family transcriptional regulator of autoinduction and epiphytic fitness